VEGVLSTGRPVCSSGAFLRYQSWRQEGKSGRGGREDDTKSKAVDWTIRLDMQEELTEKQVKIRAEGSQSGREWKPRESSL